jgi:hypothetical protein
MQQIFKSSALPFKLKTTLINIRKHPFKETNIYALHKNAAMSVHWTNPPC